MSSRVPPEESKHHNDNVISLDKSHQAIHRDIIWMCFMAASTLDLAGHASEYTKLVTRLD